MRALIVAFAVALSSCTAGARGVPPWQQPNLPPLQVTPIRQIDGAPGTCLSFVHDGSLAGARYHDSRILTWSSDGTARTWNAETGESGVVLQHYRDVSGAVMSRDETRILTTSSDGLTRYWSIAGARQIIPGMQHGSWMHSAIFSPDETVIATFGLDQTAKLWNAETGQQRLGSTLPHDRHVIGAMFAADGARLVTWSIGAAFGTRIQVNGNFFSATVRETV